MPMSVEEYRIAQLYMIQVRSRQQTPHQILPSVYSLDEKGQVLKTSSPRGYILAQVGGFKNAITVRLIVKVQVTLCDAVTEQRELVC